MSIVGDSQCAYSSDTPGFLISSASIACAYSSGMFNHDIENVFEIRCPLQSVLPKALIVLQRLVSAMVAYISAAEALQLVD